MEVAARRATPDDLADLVSLYRELEEEMTALHPMWRWADGLPEPVEQAFRSAMEKTTVLVVIGTIESQSLGFLFGQVGELLPQAKGERLGTIQLVFVSREAREVGVGEAMLDLALVDMRARGVRRFDAWVLPGHRLAKNFFEAGGFAARSIIMHHAD